MALNALLGGEVQMMFTTPVTGGPHIKSGRLRVLAVTSAEPSGLAPGAPTMAASGLPGYESTATYGMFAPAKTPRPVVSRLHAEVARVLHRPDVKEKFFNTGMEIVGGSPEQLAAVIRSDTARLGKLINDTGMRVN